ncbi:MAG: aminotransferase class IV family protein [Opitutaceae bacterium]|nr:aminotransferase class IV family protein [Opitutaceae bacterium]
MSEFIQANTNGRLHDAAEPSISPLNRGFLYGDAIYEVWRTYHGVIFGFEEHWLRLERSARALHLAHGLTRENLAVEIKRTVSAWRARTGDTGEIYVRLQVTRGAGAIGLDTTLADAPTWVLLVQRLKIGAPKAGRAGLHLSVATSLHRNAPDTLNPAWKTGNYLNNLLCLREAKARGADEVVILNQDGAITEAAVCNIFFVRRGVLITPPLGAGILEGITRELIVRDIAARAGLELREETIRPEDLAGFDECFLTSSTRDIGPVEAIDAHRYPVRPDSVSARLKSAFAAYAEEYAARHPHLRV